MKRTMLTLLAMLVMVVPAHAQFNPCGDTNNGPDWTLNGSNYNGDNGSIRHYVNHDGSPNPCADYQVSNNTVWIFGPLLKYLLPTLALILAIWWAVPRLRALLVRST